MFFNICSNVPGFGTEMYLCAETHVAKYADRAARTKEVRVMMFTQKEDYGVAGQQQRQSRVEPSEQCMAVVPKDFRLVAPIAPHYDYNPTR